MLNFHASNDLFINHLGMKMMKIFHSTLPLPTAASLKKQSRTLHNHLMKSSLQATVNVLSLFTYSSYC